ncbi:hypothetical protein [Methanobrevibacter woesei]|uniref:hypothetical protein n=1 Tax=Methanobrevibacter woesei TaxID=190976 RepID=UPI002357E75A|nr:hypothetical protein [Methanobrevibacter woesei]
MIVRKINFLMPPGGYRKVEITIYNESKISAVYLKNKGYSIFINGKEEEMFLINTDIAPNEFKLDENKIEREDFIDLVKILLDEIYAGVDIPEYEREHHEFVFLKIMDLFDSDSVEIINENSDLYKTIELGFIKLDIDILNLEVHKEPTINSDTTSNSNESIKDTLDSSVKNFKDKYLS